MPQVSETDRDRDGESASLPGLWMVGILGCGRNMLDVVITSMGKKIPDQDYTYLDQLLKSLDHGATEDYQLIIVENVAPYSEAVNRGLALSRNDVLLLNDDIVMFEGWQRIQRGVGDIRGFKLIYPKPRCIQHAGGYLDQNFDGRHYAQNAWDTSMCMTAYPCHFVTFGAVYIKSEVIDRLGHLNKFSTIFFEDVDYCLRAWEAGFTVFYNPILAIHYEGITVGADKVKRDDSYKEAKKKFDAIWRKSETLAMLDENMKKAWRMAYGKTKSVRG